MLSCVWIFIVVMLCGLCVGIMQERPGGPPRRIPNITTCEQFERRARFNPYTTIESMWKIFYFWGDNTELTPIVFSLPDKRRLVKFKEEVETIDPSFKQLEWNKATLFMNPKAGTEVLFLSGGTPGAFRAVIKMEARKKGIRPFPPPWMKLADVRMKFVQGTLGMMCCEDHTAYAMAKIDEMPDTEEQCLSRAKFIGFHRKNGQSYLAVRKRIQDEL